MVGTLLAGAGIPLLPGGSLRRPADERGTICEYGLGFGMVWEFELTRMEGGTLMTAGSGAAARAGGGEAARAGGGEAARAGTGTGAKIG